MLQVCAPLPGSWWQLITLHLGKVGRYIGIWINHHYVLLGWHCSWLLKGILAWCSYRSNCILSIDFVLIKLHIIVNEEEGVTSPPFKELLLDFKETPFHLWEPLGSKTLGTKTKEIDKKQWPVPSFHSYPCQRMRCYSQLSRLVYSTGSSYIVDGNRGWIQLSKRQGWITYEMWQSLFFFPVHLLFLIRRKKCLLNIVSWLQFARNSIRHLTKLSRWTRRAGALIIEQLMLLFSSHLISGLFQNFPFFYGPTAIQNQSDKIEFFIKKEVRSTK